jgi:hypothetical protein
MAEEEKSFARKIANQAAPFWSAGACSRFLCGEACLAGGVLNAQSRHAKQASRRKSGGKSPRSTMRRIIGGCCGPTGLAKAGLLRYFRNRGEQRLCIRMLRLLQHFVRRPDFDDACGLHHGDPRR